MTPLDFYLWGHLKKLVYARHPRTVEDLKDFIRNAISVINDRPELTNKVLVEFKRRMRLIVQTGGSHIEQLDQPSSDNEDHYHDEDDIYPDDR